MTQAVQQNGMSVPRQVLIKWRHALAARTVSPAASTEIVSSTQEKKHIVSSNICIFCLQIHIFVLNICLFCLQICLFCLQIRICRQNICTVQTVLYCTEQIYLFSTKYTFVGKIFIYIYTCRQNIHICRQNLRIFPPSITLDCPIPCTSKSHSAKSCSISWKYRAGTR